MVVGSLFAYGLILAKVHHRWLVLIAHCMIHDFAWFVIVRTINSCPKEVLLPGYVHSLLATNSTPHLQHKRFFMIIDMAMQPWHRLVFFSNVCCHIQNVILDTCLFGCFILVAQTVLVSALLWGVFPLIQQLAIFDNSAIISRGDQSVYKYLQSSISTITKKNGRLFSLCV